MKIHLVGVHEYPARLGGVASTRVADCLAKGLAELGHEVSYELPSTFVGSLPDGVQLVHEGRFDVDIMWFNGFDAGRLSPLACRIFAMENYHYLQMAREYLAEFWKEIVNGESPAWRAKVGEQFRWVDVEVRGQRFAVGVPRSYLTG